MCVYIAFGLYIYILWNARSETHLLEVEVVVAVLRQRLLAVVCFVLFCFVLFFGCECLFGMGLSFVDCARTCVCMGCVCRAPHPLDRGMVDRPHWPMPHITRIHKNIHTHTYPPVDGRRREGGVPDQLGGAEEEDEAVVVVEAPHAVGPWVWW